MTPEEIKEISETAKNLKDVIDAIARVTTLETDLQQQIGRSESDKRQEMAEELALAFGARINLVAHRRRLLESLNATQPDQ